MDLSDVKLRCAYDALLHAKTAKAVDRMVERLPFVRGPNIESVLRAAQIKRRLLTGYAAARSFSL